MRLPLLFTALLTLSGCAFSNSRGIALSDDRESSAGASSEPLPESNSRNDSFATADPSDAAETESIASNPNRIRMVQYGSKDYAWQIPVDAGYVATFNSDIQAMTRFSLTAVSWENRLNMLGFYFGGSTVVFKAGSLPDTAVRDPWTFEIGAQYRRYLNGPHAFISPYLSAVAYVEGLHWTYRSPVFSGSDTIRSDTLMGAGGYCGVGIALWRTKPASVFAEAGVGGTFFVGETYQGFHNNVFDDFGYFMARAGVTVKF